MRTRRRLRRVVFRDPPPLPPGEPAYVDAEFYHEEKYNAELKMRIFDRQPAVVRSVDQVVGNVNIAQKLVRQGLRSAQEAEPVVRKMLERLPR